MIFEIAGSSNSLARDRVGNILISTVDLHFHIPEDLRAQFRSLGRYETMLFEIRNDGMDSFFCLRFEDSELSILVHKEILEGLVKGMGTIWELVGASGRLDKLGPHLASWRRGKHDVRDLPTNFRKLFSGSN